MRDAKHRIEAFQRRFGEGHLALAYHAAFPAALTPDLLYSLWVVFRRDIKGVDLNAPWESVADLLLSRLCHEVGAELYEIDEVVQIQLRAALLANPRLGLKRVQELAAFLLEYIGPDLLSEDPATKELAQAQRFSALAPIDPQVALRELAVQFLQVPEDRQDEWLRLSRLVELTTKGQPEFDEIRNYADAMWLYSYGRLEAAARLFAKLSPNGVSVQIAGISLLVPHDLVKSSITDRTSSTKTTTQFTLNMPTTSDISPEHLILKPTGMQEVTQFAAANDDLRAFGGRGGPRNLDKLFVDRNKELDRFRKSFEGSSGRRIILVTAGPGMGKSWLLWRFMKETLSYGAHSALIDFNDGGAHDVLTLLRHLRNQLGSAYFNPLTIAINKATARGFTPNTSEASSDGFSKEVRKVRADDIHRITNIFFECMRELTEVSSVVLLFDSYEWASQEGERWISTVADSWIQRELLTRIREGRLLKTIVVLAGRRLPEFTAEWSTVTGRLDLELFSVADVAQYLREKRGLGVSDAEVQTLYNAVQGNPQLLGIVGDNLDQSINPLTDNL